MAGGESVSLPAASAGGVPRNSIARIHDAAGCRGISVTAMPGALTSIGIRPVATSTRSHWSTPGISSGAPLPIGSVMSASPTRKIVCVHELPCAPTRAAARCAHAAGVDPIADDVGDDGVEQREQVFARRQAAERVDGDGGAERRPFRVRGGRLRAGRRRRYNTREQGRDHGWGGAIESGHAGNHFQ